MTEPICLRLGMADFDAVAVAIEDYAEGDPPYVIDAEVALIEMSELLVEAQEVISRLKSGALTRDEARSMIVTEECPDTRPEGT